MATRRELKFADWNDVLADLDQLQNGCQATGKWDLAQTCRHLNDWLRFPMDGFPVQPWFIRWMMWGMKVAFGRSLFQKILKSGIMAAGNPTMPETVYSPEESADEAASQLRETIGRFRSFNGPIHDSPLFGEMNKEQAERLQLVHMAHHLSFLVPK